MPTNYSNIDSLIKGCIKQQADAQKYLYNCYAPTLYGICLRYTKNVHDAEDLLQEAFIKIFNNLDKFKFNGSFEGWLKRLTINMAINNYHNKKKETCEPVNDDYEHYSHNEIIEKMNAEQILQSINKLPEGYRMVLNLYAIDGYSHKEISDMLGISEGTSKSQLSRAKASLLSIITKENAVLAHGK